MEKLIDTIIGVDLGQASDYTAICVIERRQQYKDYPFEKQKEGEPFYYVRFLERPKLGTPYPAIVRRIQTIYDKLTDEDTGKRPNLVLDATGCGRPVFDMFREAGLNPYGISIHGGNTVSREGSMYGVPKRDLAGVLQVLYQTGRIKVAGSLPEAKTLNDELLNFKVKINLKTGHDSYEAWREGTHDDLVLSVACACWWGERRNGQKLKAIKNIPGM